MNETIALGQVIIVNAEQQVVIWRHSPILGVKKVHHCVINCNSKFDKK